MEFTLAERKALVEFLDELLDRFGNDGCNDYELKNTPENMRFLEDAIRWNCSDKKEADEWVADIKECYGNSKTICTTNSMILGFLKWKLEKVLQ